MALLDTEEELPFAPGLSPFHIKGIAYRGHLEYVAKHVPGGAEAVNAVFRNKALRFFYEQPFLAATWYDALPMVPLWYACAAVLKRPRVEFLRARTRHQAEQDIHGVYRIILKIASAEQVALRIPRVVGKYFDFGTTSAHVVAPGTVRLEQKSVPAFLAPWLGIVGDTYVQVALEIAGAQRIHTRRDPIAERASRGASLVDLRGEVSYAVPERTSVAPGSDPD
jgi:hypothetical protein